MTQYWHSAQQIFDGQDLLSDQAICVEELLNSHPTEAAISTILKAHRTLGTTALLPTVISDHPDVLRPMDGRTLDLVARLRSNGLAVLITVAPEATTPEQISKLANIGAIVSIGHSNGTAQEAETCLKAGATCFTHLYNAMSPMEGRAPGMVGAAISSDAYCSIIADGIHVDPTMVMLAYRARPKPDRMIAVSDAMPTVGGPDRFSLYGKELHLSEGRLINDQGALAGAHLTMLDAVRNLVEVLAGYVIAGKCLKRCASSQRHTRSAIRRSKTLVLPSILRQRNMPRPRPALDRCRMKPIKFQFIAHLFQNPQL